MGEITVVPERLEDLRVSLTGYREYDAGDRVMRVDIIDARELRSLLSLTPADAIALAGQLREVAGWAAPDTGTEPGS
jgi:hypothetical protein